MAPSAAVEVARAALGAQVDAATGLLEAWSQSGVPAEVFFTGAHLGGLVEAAVNLAAAGIDVLDALGAADVERALADRRRRGLVEVVGTPEDPRYRLTEAGYLQA